MLGFGKCIRLAHYKLLTLDDNYFFMNRKKTTELCNLLLFFLIIQVFAHFIAKKPK